MTESEKVNFYNLYKSTIHPKIKSQDHTKPLWRRLYWTTVKDSNVYKVGSVDMFMTHFPSSYKKLNDQN